MKRQCSLGRLQAACIDYFWFEPQALRSLLHSKCNLWLLSSIVRLVCKSNGFINQLLVLLVSIDKMLTGNKRPEAAYRALIKFDWLFKAQLVGICSSFLCWTWFRLEVMWKFAVFIVLSVIATSIVAAPQQLDLSDVEPENLTVRFIYSTYANQRKLI